MSRRTILGAIPEFRDNFGVSAAQVDQKPEGFWHDVIPQEVLLQFGTVSGVKDIALGEGLWVAQPARTRAW